MGGVEEEEKENTKKINNQEVLDYLSEVLNTALQKSGNGKRASCGAAAHSETQPLSGPPTRPPQKSLANREQLL